MQAASFSNMCITSTHDCHVTAGMQGVAAGSSKFVLLQEHPLSPRPPPWPKPQPSRQRLLLPHHLLLLLVVELSTLASTVGKPGASFGRPLDPSSASAAAHWTELTDSLQRRGDVRPDKLK
jgi:hypothetical protein